MISTFFCLEPKFTFCNFYLFSRWCLNSFCQYEVHDNSVWIKLIVILTLVSQKTLKMGCGSSQVDPSGTTDTDKRPLPKSARNGTARNNQNGQTEKISTDANANQTNKKAMPPPGPCE